MKTTPVPPHVASRGATKSARRGDMTDAFSRRVYRFYNAPLSLLLPPLGVYTLWRRHVKKKSAASLRGQWGHVPDDVIGALHGAKQPSSSSKNANADKKTSATLNADATSNADARTSNSASPGQHMSTHVLWIHAVSVGESIAARPVLRALREAMPDCRLALSVTTDTGFETAQAIKRSGEVDAVFYFPLDAPIAIRRALKAIRPDAFLTMETELWPNFLHIARTWGVRTFLINGRVSDNLLRVAPRLGPIWKWMMRNLDGCLMRSRFDAERMTTLGADPKRVEVTGDVKLDAVASPVQEETLRARWRDVLGIAPNEWLWVAGSTHAGEEEIVFETWLQLRRSLPSLRLLLAPRHIERAPEIIALAQKFQIPIVRRTEMSSSKACHMSTHAAQSASDDAVQRADDAFKPGAISSANDSLHETGSDAVDGKSVILLDTVGELGEIYAAGDVAFVGGSLIERGGHNVLEPVLRGVPVAFGPHVANFREAARLVESARGGKMVHNGNELRATLEQWLHDEDRRSVAGRAREALSEHRGAAQRVAQIVARALA